MLEKDVEAHLVKRVKGLGGLCLKFTSPQRVSVPDRICLLRGGIMCFVELKRPGGKPTSGQLREHERLRGLGFPVFVIDTKEGCQHIVDWYTACVGGGAQVMNEINVNIPNELLTKAQIQGLVGQLDAVFKRKPDREPTGVLSIKAACPSCGRTYGHARNCDQESR